MIRDPALIIVDMQKDYCKPGFAFDTDWTDLSEMDSALQATASFLERYRDSGRTPILVRTIHDDATDESLQQEKYGENAGQRPCSPGTEGSEFVPELDVRESDVVVTQHRYNGFYNTDLDLILSSNDVSSVLVGGVNTNVCVQYTAQAAHSRNYEVTLLTDCMASNRPDLGRAAEENMARVFATVAESSEISLD